MAMTISAPPPAKTPMAQVSGPFVELNLVEKYLQGIGGAIDSLPVLLLVITHGSVVQTITVATL